MCCGFSVLSPNFVHIWLLNRRVVNSWEMLIEKLMFSSLPQHWHGRVRHKMSHVMRKPVFRGLRPGLTQSGLLSYNDWLEFWNFKYSVYRYYTIQRANNRRWSDCADAQSDLRLCCSHMAEHRFSHDGPKWLKNDIKTVVRSHFTCPVWEDFHFLPPVGNSKFLFGIQETIICWYYTGNGIGCHKCSVQRNITCTCYSNVIASNVYNF